MINKRISPNGAITYRVRFRKKGMRTFVVTFTDAEVAATWAKENYKRFFEDPASYFAWKEELYFRMRKEDVKVMDYICLPKRAKR